MMSQSGIGRPSENLGKILGFVLTHRRPSTLLHSCNPSRRATAPSTTTCSQTFEGYDRFSDLFPFLAQFGEHLADIHLLQG